MSLPNVDLTSTWIPLGFLGVLLLYMVHLFLQERKESLAFVADGPNAPAAPVPEVRPAPVAEPVETARRGLVRRTAWIWLPFVAGFAGQAYLDVVKPLLENSAG